MSKPKHPMQPLVRDGNVIRFKPNKLVRFLLDSGPFDLNQLAAMPFTDEDREQFAQLIGYSVAGFCELSYVSEKSVAFAHAEAEKMNRK